MITDTAANFILAYTHMYFLIEEVCSIVMMPLGCNVKGSYFVTKLEPFPKPLVHSKQESTQMINSQNLCRGSTTLGTFIGTMKRKRALIGIKAIGHSSIWSCSITILAGIGVACIGIKVAIPCVQEKERLQSTQ